MRRAYPYALATAASRPIRSDQASTATAHASKNLETLIHGGSGLYNTNMLDRVR